MSRRAIIAGMITAAGIILWLYGYVVTGHPSLIDWQANTPWWIADYLPNIEAEIGMLLLIVGMIPIYWPTKSERRDPV